MSLHAGMLVAIDPGCEESAFVELSQDGAVVRFNKCRNATLLGVLAAYAVDVSTVLVVEKIESYGMAVGKTIFQTVWWSGRFWEAWVATGCQAAHLTRREVKLHLCGTSRAKDANIRQALIDRYGPSKEQAIGRKKTPGPLYGVKADIWAAGLISFPAATTFSRSRTVSSLSISTTLSSAGIRGMPT